jgi:hypothetical protein
MLMNDSPIASSGNESTPKSLEAKAKADFSKVFSFLAVEKQRRKIFRLAK